LNSFDQDLPGCCSLADACNSAAWFVCSPPLQLRLQAVAPLLMQQRACSPLMGATGMPAVLEQWGCDQELWAKIRSKKALIDMAADGNEEAAKERIATLRASPSVSGVSAKMPAALASWGADAELWEKVRSKSGLLKLAAEGNEEAGRARIASLRERIAAEEAEAAAKPKPAAPKRAPRAPNPKTGSKLGKKLSEGYSLKGSLTAGFDAAPVEALLAKRVEAKLAKDYATADELQAQVVALGVYLNDRERWWSVDGTR